MGIEDRRERFQGRFDFGPTSFDERDYDAELFWLHRTTWRQKLGAIAFIAAVYAIGLAVIVACMHLHRF